jgi:ketosteroid isomerase-like protein
MITDDRVSVRHDLVDAAPTGKAISRTNLTTRGSTLSGQCVRSGQNGVMQQHAQGESGEFEVRRALASLIPLLESPDPAARLQRYTSDAIFVQPGAEPVRGHEEMRVRNVTVLHGVTLEPELIEVRDDLAYAFGWFNCGVDTPDGQRVEVPAHFLMVLRKEPDGAWRIAREFITPTA